MQKTNFGSLSVLQFDIFKKEQHIKHCITTKEGWKSGQKPNFRNLIFTRGRNIEKNWLRHWRFQLISCIFHTRHIPMQSRL